MVKKIYLFKIRMRRYIFKMRDRIQTYKNSLKVKTLFFNFYLIMNQVQEKRTNIIFLIIIKVKKINN